MECVCCDKTDADTRYVTTDGTTWSAEAITPGVSIGAIAHDPETGVFVAVTSGYLNGYDAQRFYRSDDGLTWDTLAPNAYVASHPIVGIAFGHVAL